MLSHHLRTMIQGQPVLSKVLFRNSYVVTFALTELGSIAVLIETLDKVYKQGWMHKGGVLAEYYNPGDVDRVRGPRIKISDSFTHEEYSWLEKALFTRMCSRWLDKWIKTHREVSTR